MPVNSGIGIPISKAVKGSGGFPSSPADGDLFFRTDYQEQYFYDSGRGLWRTPAKELSIPSRDPQNSPGLSQASHSFEVAIPKRNGGVLPLSVSLSFFFLTVAQSTTNFYSLSGGINANDGSGTGFSWSGTLDTKLMTSTLRVWELAPLITTGSLAAKYFDVYLTLNMNGAPGTFYCAATLYYALL